MNKKHEKSTCCKSKIIRFGDRRRQCTQCHRTFRVWQRKRGRKKRRSNSRFAVSFLRRDVASLASLARKRKCSETHVQNLLKKSRDLFIQNTSWPDIPDGQLVLIADAVLEYIEQKWRTVYLMLVRPVSGTEALLIPPVIALGTETPEGWRQAMCTIPSSIKTRIIALVCDGHNGLIIEGTLSHWIIQRCHFHLIARLQMRLSWRIPEKRTNTKIIFSHIYTILQSKDNCAVHQSLLVLSAKRKDSSSKEIRRILSGFITNYQSYRSYLVYPEYSLPTTNNSAESLASSLADLKHRLRGFPTIKSFKQWVVALLKFKKKITCNGFYQPNNVG